MTRANRWRADFRRILEGAGTSGRAIFLSIGIAASLTGCFGGSGPAHSEYFVVPFGAGTTQPTADGRRSLAAAGEAGRRGKVSRVIVQSGTGEASEARAAAAREALIAAGVAAEKIAVTSVENGGPADGRDITIQVLIGKPARPEGG